MSSVRRSEPNGIRGWWLDAAGSKWTGAVTFIVYGAATGWAITWSETHIPPLSALAHLLDELQIASSWLDGIVQWFDTSGQILLPYLCVAAGMLLLLGSSSRRQGVYSEAGILLLLLAFEVAGGLLPFVWLLIFAAVLCFIAWITSNVAGRLEHNSPEPSVYRNPVQVFVEVFIAACAPLTFALILLGALRACFVYPPRETYWQSVDKHLKELDKVDPVVGRQARISILMQLLDEEDPVDRSMIQYISQKEPE